MQNSTLSMFDYRASLSIARNLQPKVQQRLARFSRNKRMEIEWKKAWGWGVESCRWLKEMWQRKLLCVFNSLFTLALFTRFNSSHLASTAYICTYMCIHTYIHICVSVWQRVYFCSVAYYKQLKEVCAPHAAANWRDFNTTSP